MRLCDVRAVRGILRLRNRFASRNGYYAQDDILFVRQSEERRTERVPGTNSNKQRRPRGRLLKLSQAERLGSHLTIAVSPSVDLMSSPNAPS